MIGDTDSVTGEGLQHAHWQAGLLPRPVGRRLSVLTETPGRVRLRRTVTRTARPAGGLGNFKLNGHGGARAQSSSQAQASFASAAVQDSPRDSGKPDSVSRLRLRLTVTVTVTH